MDTQMESQPRIRITGQLILGLAIAAAGILFTLDNLHIQMAPPTLPAAVLACAVWTTPMATRTSGQKIR